MNLCIASYLFLGRWVLQDYFHVEHLKAHHFQIVIFKFFTIQFKLIFISAVLATQPSLLGWALNCRVLLPWSSQPQGLPAPSEQQQNHLNLTTCKTEDRVYEQLTHLGTYSDIQALEKTGMPVLYNKLILNAASKCQAPRNPTRVAIRRLVIHNRLPEGLDSICFYYPWRHGMRMWKCKREKVWEQELNRHCISERKCFHPR